MSAGPWKRHSQSPRHCSWLWPRMLRPAGCKQRQRVQLPEGPQFCILLRGPQTKNGSPAGQTKVIHRREAERERRSLSPWRAAGSTDIIVAWDPLSFDYNIKEMEIFVSAMVTKVSLLHPAKPTFSILYMKESISGIKRPLAISKLDKDYKKEVWDKEEAYDKAIKLIKEQVYV